MTKVCAGSWREWKRRCAAARCSDVVQSQLRSFVFHRFRHYVRRYCGRTNVFETDSVMRRFGRDDPWHLFESHAVVPGSRAGKRYKDWIFARAAGASGRFERVVESGVSLVVRSVVRDCLHNECLSRNMLPLETAVQAGGLHGVCVEELLHGTPDPADEAAAREFEDLAAHHAAQVFRSMTSRERVAVLAKRLGVPLGHERVTRAAGCGKSVLHEAYRERLKHIGLALRAQYADDGDESIMALTLMTVEHLKKVVFSWAKADISVRELLTLVGEDHTDSGCVTEHEEASQTSVAVTV